MRKAAILFIIIFFAGAFGISAQTVYPVLLAALPDTIHESSGIETNSRNNIWTHNDSGDLPRIFKIDTLGNLIRVLNLSNVVATDIEDMTQDAEGNYYIGDFGNNFNNRQDLRIYKIPNPDSLTVDSVIPGIITFNYPDQIFFPPDTAHMNFDCEAMFHFKDSLYLFSKNRGISTYSKMYRLPDQPGNYTAQLIDSFNTIKWITSSDISPSGKSVVLMSNDRIWLLTDFSGSDFFAGNALELMMAYTQKEAIVFIDNTEVYITDEQFFWTGGNLYSLNLKQWIDVIPDILQYQYQVNIYTNPASGIISFNVQVTRPTKAKIEIFNVMGCTVLTESREFIQGANYINLSLARIQHGLYFLRVTFSNNSSITEKLIINRN
jgi:hypothetical protein